MLDLQFEEAFNEPDQTQGLRNLVDPRLGDDYPMDSVSKVQGWCPLNFVKFEFEISIS